jgi:hypothetical protein
MERREKNGHSNSASKSVHRIGSGPHHRSAVGEFSLSSDAVIPTFKWVARIKTLIPADEVRAFNAIGYTIGGMMVFPLYGPLLGGVRVMVRAHALVRARELLQTDIGEPGTAGHE